MKRIRSLFILIGGLLLFLLFWNIKPDCVFKGIFSLPCPACGMTRALEHILTFDIIGSFSYNVLAFPLFLLCIVLIPFLVYDIITNKDLFIKILFYFLEKYYLLIIIFLILSWIINLYRGI